jgi:putative ABC transport system permease protein
MLRKEIRAVAPQAPDDPVLRATAIEDMVSRSLAGPRFSATLFSAFSANALLLAAIGVFGLVSYSVSQRRSEYGIRAALGAHAGNLITMTMRSAVLLIAIGVALGIVAAVYLAQFVETQLYGIEPLDVPTFVGAVGVMAAVALVASYLPARRAARVDPLVALRYE